MILMQENPFRAPLEGVGLFWALIWQQAKRVPFRPKKVEIFRAYPFKGPSNGFSPIKIIKSKCHIKNRYIGNFMHMSFCILWCSYGYEGGTKSIHFVPSPPQPPPP